MNAYLTLLYFRSFVEWSRMDGLWATNHSSLLTQDSPQQERVADCQGDGGKCVGDHGQDAAGAGVKEPEVKAEPEVKEDPEVKKEPEKRSDGQHTGGEGAKEEDKDGQGLAPNDKADNTSLSSTEPLATKIDDTTVRVTPS